MCKVVTCDVQLQCRAEFAEDPHALAEPLHNGRERVRVQHNATLSDQRLSADANGW